MLQVGLPENLQYTQSRVVWSCRILLQNRREIEAHTGACLNQSNSEDMGGWI
jgi:hypothetical protein